MSSSDPLRRLNDIVEQIARIESHVAGMDLDAFCASTLTQDAVERCFERICEASRKIGAGLDAKYPEVDFPNLRKFGSILRHDYDDVDTDFIWHFVIRRLPLLKAAARAELGL
ncbi:MAG TPA: HepT-like ribonuclease domain-containing protein [Parvibaculum sp.]